MSEEEKKITEDVETEEKLMKKFQPTMKKAMKNLKQKKKKKKR